MRNQQYSNNSFQELPQDSSLINLRANDPMLSQAFELLPDAIFLFGDNRLLLKANAAAAQLQDGELLNGKACCDMFWRVEGADGCVVDRALQTPEKVEVEILAGQEGKNSISIVVEPLNAGNDMDPAALVIARDISDLRRAEAEAI